MLNMKIELRGMNKAEAKVKRKVQKVMFKTMLKMEEIAIEKAPLDKGFLRLNITLFPQLLANNYVLVSRAGYSADLEYGNTPRFVKLDPLVSWVKRKGIATDDRSAYAIAIAIQRKIKEKGVNAQPFMRPAFHITKSIWFPQFAKTEFARQ